MFTSGMWLHAFHWTDQVNTSWSSGTLLRTMVATCHVRGVLVTQKKLGMHRHQLDPCKLLVTRSQLANNLPINQPMLIKHGDCKGSPPPAVSLFSSLFCVGFLGFSHTRRQLKSIPSVITCTSLNLISGICLCVPLMYLWENAQASRRIMSENRRPQRVSFFSLPFKAIPKRFGLKIRSSLALLL